MEEVISAKKVIVWRILSIIVSTIIAYLYLGEFRAAGELTIILTLVMTTLHYFFELWWARRYHETG